MASLAAIVVSVVSAYFQFFWRDNDLRIQWYFGDTGSPSLTYLPKSKDSTYGSIRIGMSPTMVFINSGNQNVTVTDVTLELLQANAAPIANLWRHGQNPPLAACKHSALGGALAAWQKLEINGETKVAQPLVVPAGTSMPVRVWFRPMEESVDDSWRPNSEVTTCFSFQLIDSQGRTFIRRIPAMTFGTGGGSGEEHQNAVRLL